MVFFFYIPILPLTYRRPWWVNELDWHTLLYDGITSVSLRGNFWTVWIKNTVRHNWRARSDRKFGQLNKCTDIQETSQENMWVLCCLHSVSLPNLWTIDVQYVCLFLSWYRSNSWGKKIYDIEKRMDLYAAWMRKHWSPSSEAWKDAISSGWC